MQRLLEYSAGRPQQCLTFSAQAGGTVAASDLLQFLGQPASLLPSLVDALDVGRGNWISTRLRWDARNATSGSAQKQAVTAQTVPKAADVCDRTPARAAKGAGAHPIAAGDPWCMQPGCVATSTTAGQSCQACHANFVDIAWGQNVRAGGSASRTKLKGADTRQGQGNKLGKAKLGTKAKFGLTKSKSGAPKKAKLGLTGSKSGSMKGKAKLAGSKGKAHKKAAQPLGGT